MFLVFLVFKICVVNVIKITEANIIVIVANKRLFWCYNLWFILMIKNLFVAGNTVRDLCFFFISIQFPLKNMPNQGVYRLFGFEFRTLRMILLVL